MKTFFRAAKFELRNRKIGTTWSAWKLTVFSDIIFREENVSYWFQKAVTQKENYHLKILGLSRYQFQINSLHK